MKEKRGGWAGGRGERGVGEGTRVKLIPQQNLPSKCPALLGLRGFNMEASVAEKTVIFNRNSPG